MHAGTADWRADGVVRRRLRRALQLRTAREHGDHLMRSDLLTAVGSAATDPNRNVLSFRDARIEMAHGAGGKATRQLIDALIAPLVDLPREALNDAAIVQFCGDT